MIFSKLFRPSNSIILVRDIHSKEEADIVKEEMKEVGEYYHFSKVSDLHEKLVARRGLGDACLVFIHPRKALFLHLIPDLLADKIPFTLFVRPDCVGTNRLPLVEEIELYQAAYPEKKATLGISHEMLWKNPQQVDSLLVEWRKSVGPFPFDKADPLRFFSTWGKITQLPPELVDVGINLYFDPTQSENLQRERVFIERQVGRKLEVGYLGQGEVPNDMSLVAVVTAREGAIDLDTDPLDLPQWKFSS